MSQTSTLAPSEAMPLEMPAPNPEPPPAWVLVAKMKAWGVQTGDDGDFAIKSTHCVYEISDVYGSPKVKVRKWSSKSIDVKLLTL
jgi:hypothetical protein